MPCRNRHYQAIGAEQAGIYFRAIRQIGIGSLNLAHVTKAENGDMKPFGSTFWHNGARSTFFVKVPEAEAGRDIKHVGLLNRKANLTALRDYGYQLAFGPESIDVQSIASAPFKNWPVVRCSGGASRAPSSTRRSR